MRAIVYSVRAVRVAFTAWVGVTKREVKRGGTPETLK